MNLCASYIPHSELMFMPVTHMCVCVCVLYRRWKASAVICMFERRVGEDAFKRVLSGVVR